MSFDNGSKYTRNFSSRREQLLAITVHGRISNDIGRWDILESNLERNHKRSNNWYELSFLGKKNLLSRAVVHRSHIGVHYNCGIVNNIYTDPT